MSMKRFCYYRRLFRLRAKNKVRHETVKQECHHVLYQRGVLIEQEFDRRFLKIPLRIDHPRTKEQCLIVDRDKQAISSQPTR